MPNIYVLSKDGRPLMPVHSFGRAKRMICNNKARIVNYKPFTIQLTYDLDEEVVDSCILGIDPGRTNIGVCVVNSKGQVLFASDIETRNKTIAKLMLNRKQHRQASRRGERKRRQRRAIKAGTCFVNQGMGERPSMERFLPHYKKPVTLYEIRNSESKFCNRKRPNGWLTPTANQLLQTHVNLVKKIQKFLPISRIVLEINRFDFAKMENPNIQNWEYQQGKLFGYHSKAEAIADRQGGHCLFCDNGIEHDHHVIPVKKGGSESIDNQVGFCLKCHIKMHKSIKLQIKMKKLHKGILKKYHALSVMNQIMPKLCQELSLLLPLDVTTGYETMQRRTYFGLDKQHYVDAWCIALTDVLDYEGIVPMFEDSLYQIKQYRRHDRAIVHYMKSRVYKLGTKKVAVNRNKAMMIAASGKEKQQKEDSLAEFRLKMTKKYGKTKARNIISNLQVVNSTRSYNRMDRMLPGAECLYQGKRYIMSGRSNGGKYLRFLGQGTKNHKIEDCNIISQNKGLIFI